MTHSAKSKALLFLKITSKTTFCVDKSPMQAHTNCAVFMAGMVSDNLIIWCLVGVPAKKIPTDIKDLAT